MKVKFTNSMVFGNGLAYSINQVAELDEAVAADLISSGLVEQVDEAIPAGVRLKGTANVGVVQAPVEEDTKPKKPKKTKAESVE